MTARWQVGSLTRKIVIAYRDKDTENTLVIEDKVTGIKAKLTFNPGFDDPVTFCKIDKIWDLLLNAPGDLDVMASRFKQIVAIEGCTTEVSLGQTNPVLGQVEALMQELPASAQKSSAKWEFATPTIDELIRGKETYLIDMVANPVSAPPVTGTAPGRGTPPGTEPRGRGREIRQRWFLQSRRRSPADQTDRIGHPREH